MTKTLGGATLIRNGIEFDYNFRETITQLALTCDKTIVIEAGSDDGTAEECDKLVEHLSSVKIVHLHKEMWESRHGREKLSYFSNIAIAALGTDYVFYLQADEILDDDAHLWIRKAMDSGHEGFLTSRWNLWNSPNQMLNVPEHRMPCSTKVIRLAKPQYLCVDDAESRSVPNPNTDYLDKIVMWHLGFVRYRDKMKKKVRHIQESIFEIGYDQRIDLDEVFEPLRYFSESDLIPIPKHLPQIIQAWAAERQTG